MWIIQWSVQIHVLMNTNKIGQYIGMPVLLLSCWSICVFCMADAFGTDQSTCTTETAIKKCSLYWYNATSNLPLYCWGHFYRHKQLTCSDQVIKWYTIHVNCYCAALRTRYYATTWCKTSVLLWLKVGEMAVIFADCNFIYTAGTEF